MNRKDWRMWTEPNRQCLNCSVWLHYGLGLCWECLRIFLVGLAAALASGAGIALCRRLFG